MYVSLYTLMKCYCNLAPDSGKLHTLNDQGITDEGLAIIYQCGREQDQYGKNT